MDEKRLVVPGGRIIITDDGVSIMSSRECVMAVVADEVARDPKMLQKLANAVYVATREGINGLKIKLRANKL